jgi:dTMP kinase
LANRGVVYDDGVSSGKFITFEGLDGSGKTTQLDKLADALREKGRQVVVTREPGGTPIGEQIRAVLLDARTHGLAARAEMALMFASRAQQIHEVIKPALREGKIVLCDRFTDSSEAYQGFGRQLGSETILEMHRVVCQDFNPDLTLLLVGDVRSHLERARARNTKDDDREGRFEREQADFFERVARGYEAIAMRETKRVVTIDAKHSIEEVHAAVTKVVKERLPGIF